MDLKLKDKVVFVSASGQGVGAETAKEFLEEGAKVLINDIDKDRLLAIHKKLKKKYKSRIDSFLGDMTNEKAVVELKRHLFSRWGKIDVLVVNLGTGKPKTPNRLDVEEWWRFMNVNLFGGLRILNSILPEMKKRKKGSIILISSTVGIQRSLAPLGYSAAKSSVLVLAKNLSSELAPYNIRVNTLAPGNIYFKNGRWEEIIKQNPKVVRDYIKRDVPLKRFGIPSEVASAVVFLASPRSSFTTGACLVVDGGETKNY